MTGISSAGAGGLPVGQHYKVTEYAVSQLKAVPNYVTCLKIDESIDLVLICN